jgi:hypothetical protein
MPIPTGAVVAPARSIIATTPATVTADTRLRRGRRLTWG